MSLSGPERLPRELIALVYSYLDVRSMLHLAQASRSLHTLCYTATFFQTKLLSSSRDVWKGDGRYLAAVRERAGVDVQAWARYALADERAADLIEKWDATEAREKYRYQQIRSGSNNFPDEEMEWLPHLAAVQHPYLKAREYGYGQLFSGHTIEPRFILCIGLIMLDGESVEAADGEINIDFPVLSAILDFATMFHLLAVVIASRRGLWRRGQRSLNNGDSMEPMFPPRTTLSLPLRPVNSDYSLPLPFADVLSRGPAIPWPDWLKQHTKALTRAETYLTQSDWTGYETHFNHHCACAPHYVTFTVDYHPENSSKKHVSQVPKTWDRLANVHAANCQDEHGEFSLHGNLYIANDGLVALRVSLKRPDDSQTKHWEWDCRLTPLGIAGYCGVWSDAEQSFSNWGAVWNWRHDWRAEI